MPRYVTEAILTILFIRLKYCHNLLSYCSNVLPFWGKINVVKITMVISKMALIYSSICFIKLAPGVNPQTCKVFFEQK
jgi:hypothetical protein